MMKEVKDFQSATVNRIAEIFRAAVIEGACQRRVLLADEVGLGKTIVARAVIDKVRNLRRDVNDDMYRVVYVCSNLNIIKQNLKHLGIDGNDVVDITESRLSMQHMTLALKKAELKNAGKYGHGQMPEILLPLTPGTSFNIGNSCGTMGERAMLFNIVKTMDAFEGCAGTLKELFRMNVSEKNWDNLLSEYRDKIDACGSEYLETIKREFEHQNEFNDFKKMILVQCMSSYADVSEVRKAVLMLRKMSARISVSQLDPDLIVMDEFQRFSELLHDSEDSEQGMIAKAFFGDYENERRDQPLILLLSATPYKPYTTLEELNENNCDDHYEDFKVLMDFLLKKNPDVQFSKIWSAYGRALSELSAENWTVLIAAKDEAEKELYKTMCRTERPNEGLLMERKKVLEITEGDILSYAHMQKVLKDCTYLGTQYPSVRNIALPWQISIDYVKSSPYLLSFMEQYELKKRIADVFLTLRTNGHDIKLPVSQRQQTYLLREESLKAFAPIAPNNARLKMLMDEVFANHAERLLWMPASHPYYLTPASNVFEKNHNFSKILVFSAWEMVPRMISILLSYEMERLTVKPVFNQSVSVNSNDRSKNDERGTYLFHKKWSSPLASANESLICYPSRVLSEIYSPREFYGQSIDLIRKTLSGRIKKLIRTMRPDVVFEGQRCNEPLVLKICRVLDQHFEDDSQKATSGDFSRESDDELSSIPERVSESVISVMVNAAIGSPAVCAYRILHELNENERKQKSAEIAEGFRTLFGRRTSIAILELLYARKSQDFYYEQILDYCVMGNLQSVLDEFAHMLGDSAEKVSNGICEALVDKDATMEVDTTSSFGYANRKKFPMRVHFALPFNQAKFDDTKISRSNSVRQAFNSPFRPFVLASTSAGQEGLDFHWYCRKIMHWNLPSNPQDIEQREGRINRYKNLAVRRNIARLYSANFEWKAMFYAAEKDLHAKYPEYNDMVPYWCLPSEIIPKRGINSGHLSEIDSEFEMIERIVPLYPMSVDADRYDRLIKVLSLYRLTMGQPRQEELLQMLDGRVNEEQAKQLLFDLSPFSRNMS